MFWSWWVLRARAVGFFGGLLVRCGPALQLGVLPAGGILAANIGGRGARPCSASIRGPGGPQPVGGIVGMFAPDLSGRILRLAAEPRPLPEGFAGAAAGFFWRLA